jgi:hypothetical protein
MSNINYFSFHPSLRYSLVIHHLRLPLGYFLIDLTN